MGDGKYEIEINKETYEKLTTLAKFLHLSVADLITYALDEFFCLIQNDPNVFLHNIGFIKKMQDTLRKPR